MRNDFMLLQKFFVIFVCYMSQMPQAPGLTLKHCYNILTCNFEWCNTLFLSFLPNILYTMNRNWLILFAKMEKHFSFLKGNYFFKTKLAGEGNHSVYFDRYTYTIQNTMKWRGFFLMDSCYLILVINTLSICFAFILTIGKCPWRVVKKPK